MKPPCIICGKRRGHDGPVHEEWRVQYRRTKNLLRRSWPAFKGKGRLLAWFARQEPPRPAPAARVEWECKVLRSGEVIHRPVPQAPEVESKC